MRRERGFALVVVLWSMALLALLGARVVATGRGELALAANLRTAAAAEALADGALYEAIFHLLAGPPHRWAPDGAVRELRLPGGSARIRIENEAGKIGLNSAPPELLRALFLRLGIDEGRATRLASAILDWRSPGQRARPFGAKDPEYRAAGRVYAPPLSGFWSLDELGLVLGMTPELLALVTPHLSLYAGREPDMRFADQVVAQAVLDVAGPDRAEYLAATARVDQPDVVLITAAAVTEDARRARFTRRAHVRLGAGMHGRGWKVLSWEVPGD
ncbi:type II secretion system minor pseudopilin [Paracraurococcus lichenis]|uniref:Type II secretion system protein GspK n=1 Tax=Paracraurococcus lichenis TaxID=3064888 RepID=A0ABT9E5X3_9PROT|nr:type II secretion system protein GspK [Paracraurococcus sp. LOR1-02]MDO9711568.1 type II secretion system protein GspK [Paracraurococcus sp. LOR1-02]